MTAAATRRAPPHGAIVVTTAFIIGRSGFLLTSRKDLSGSLAEVTYIRAKAQERASGDASGVSGMNTGFSPKFGQDRIDPALQPRALGAELIDYGALAITLWRKRFIIMAGGLAAAVAAVAVLVNVTSTYEATAEIMLDTRAREVINIDNVVDRPDFGVSAILSEISVIRSNGVLRPVAEELRLYELEEFNPALREPTLRQRATRSLRSLFAPAAPEEAEPADPRPPAHTAADILRNQLTVQQTGQSYIIAVTVESENSWVAARTANAVALSYLDLQVEAKRDASRQATTWLAERARLLRGSVESAEAAVDAMRARLSDENRMSPEAVNRQLNELAVELVRARARLSEAVSRAETFSWLAKAGEIGAAQQIVSTPTLVRLIERRDNIQQQSDALRRQGDAGEQDAQRMSGPLQAVNDAIASETREIAEGLRAVVSIAEKQAAGIEGQIGALEDLLANQSEEMIELRSLEREAAAQRAVYERFLTRLTETRERGDFQEPDARILSFAEPPSDPASPRRTLLTAIALVMGAGAAAAGVMVADTLRHGFRTLEEVRARTGAHLVALLPRERRRRGAREIAPETQAAIERLAAGLLSRGARKRQVVMVCSVLPREGATRLTLRLAQTVASGGRSVAVVDCDPYGAAELKRIVPSGKAPERELLRPPSAAFDVRPIRETDMAAGSSRTEALSAAIDELRTRYDLVLLDAPPILAAADALLLGPAADATVLVFRWNRTPQGAVVEAIADLDRVGAPVTAMIVTEADLDAAARYAYRGSAAVNTAVGRYVQKL